MKYDSPGSVRFNIYLLKSGLGSGSFAEKNNKFTNNINQCDLPEFSNPRLFICIHKVNSRIYNSFQMIRQLIGFTNISNFNIKLEVRMNENKVNMAKFLKKISELTPRNLIPYISSAFFLS